MLMSAPASKHHSALQCFAKTDLLQAGHHGSCHCQHTTIPIVQSICESGDQGTPVALDASSLTGRAFLQLAAAVVRQVDKRNIEQEPTKIVSVKK